MEEKDNLDGVNWSTKTQIFFGFFGTLVVVGLVTAGYCLSRWGCS